eukprot:gene43777-55494_t
MRRHRADVDWEATFHLIRRSRGLVIEERARRWAASAEALRGLELLSRQLRAEWLDAGPVRTERVMVEGLPPGEPVPQLGPVRVLDPTPPLVRLDALDE